MFYLLEKKATLVKGNHEKKEEENINTTLIFWNVSSLPLSYYFIFNLLMRTIGTSLHKSQSRSFSKVYCLECLGVGVG